MLTNRSFMNKNLPLILLRRRLKDEEDYHLTSDSYPNLSYQTEMYNVFNDTWLGLSYSG